MSSEKSYLSFIAGTAFLCLSFQSTPYAQEFSGRRARDYGVETGILLPGRWNAITDVEGVLVGHKTKKSGDSVRTGVTAVLPHGGNLFREKVPAAIYTANGFGKLAGVTQVEELGELETPVILTNTLSVGTAVKAVVTYTLNQTGNGQVRSVNAVVGETNDGYLNDIRGFHVTEEDVTDAIRSARTGPVDEGCVGAGTGTQCLGFKGGIGTSSRKLSEESGGWTVGVLVQANFGGILQMNGAPVGRELGRYYLKEQLETPDEGSCMIVVATDAPLSARNLKRAASRAILGLARCGGFCSNGSGDYVIAFSTHPECRISDASRIPAIVSRDVRNDAMSPLFLAVVEATEEAVLNALFTAETTVGRNGHRSEALPIQEVLRLCEKYKVLHWHRMLAPYKERSKRP